MEGFPAYNLVLYFKQGDDLNKYIQEHHGNMDDALHNWAAELAMNSEILTDIAHKLRDYKVDYEANSHTVCLVPQDEESFKVLEELAASEEYPLFREEGWHDEMCHGTDCDCSEEEVENN